MRRHSFTTALARLIAVTLLTAIGISSAKAMPPRPVPYDENGVRVAAGPGLEKLAAGLERAPGIDGRYTGKSAPRSGIARLPVLLVQFPGWTGQTLPAAFSNALFSTGTYPTGSMNDYYREMGMVQIAGQVTPWLTAPNAKSFYVNGFGGMLNSFPANSQGLVRDAVIAADPFVNFRAFDNDGPDGVSNSGDDDGVVDCVVVVAAGYAAESYSPANPQQEIWSHYWWLSAGAGPGPLTVDGVRVDPYTIQSELRNTSGVQIRDIGVFCHEYGHAMGLPDLWSTCPTALQSSFGAWNGIGHYDLMGFGGWGAGGANPDRPLHMSAFSKALLGWANIIPVSVDMLGAPVNAVETSGDVYWVSRVPWFGVGIIDSGIPPPNWDLNLSPLEGWLVENRQPIGFDSALPGSGLLVYHLDGSVAWGDYDNDTRRNYPDNAVQWSERRPLVRLECADQTGPDHALDNDDLASQLNMGDATDFFRLGNATAFDLTTQPSSVRYGTLFGPSQFALQNVGPTGAVMTADFLVGLPGGPNDDVWLKDCAADDGSTPSYGNCTIGGAANVRASPDIWLDNNADGVADGPVWGAWNYFYAKVRNRGISSAALTTIYFYDLTSLGTAPPLAIPPPPRNPNWAPALFCSTYALAFAPGDSVITWMAQWLSNPTSPYPPSLAICAETVNDRMGMTGDVGRENNFAICTGQALYSKAGTSPKTGAHAHAVRKDDPPPLPITQIIPINNPYEVPHVVTVDMSLDVPPEWTGTLLGPDGMPLALPWTVSLAAQELVELTLSVEPGPGSHHGQTGHAWIGEYQAELYPSAEGQLGSVDLPLAVDVRPTVAVPRVFSRLVDRLPCVPPAVEAQVTWDPVAFDVAGDPEKPAYYAIYRQAVPLLPLLPGNLVAKVVRDAVEETATWEWTDPELPVNLEDDLPYYAIVAVDRAGNESAPTEFAPTTGLPDDGRPATLRLAIEPNHPNPFNPKTILRFSVPREGRARLAIYDARGRIVATLVDGTLPAGKHEAVWNGHDRSGRSVPGGVYFARIEAAGQTSTRAMSLVK